MASVLLDKIVEHKKDGDSTVSIADGFTITRDGKMVPKEQHVAGSCYANGKMDQQVGCHLYNSNSQILLN
jgi:hypothetical protein